MNTATFAMPGAQAYVKVLDLSRVLAGPWGKQLLGDRGAEVIKSECPRSGDDIAAPTPHRTTRQWVELLEQHAVPCGPINTIANVFEDPPVQHRSMQMHMRHPQTGEVLLVTCPLWLSVTPAQYWYAPPQLGGSPQNIELLKTQGVVQ